MNDSSDFLFKRIQRLEKVVQLLPLCMIGPTAFEPAASVQDFENIQTVFAELMEEIKKDIVNGR